MPMPEIDDVFSFYPSGEAIEEALEIYGQACYAAGKAGALPPWPPENGATFKHPTKENWWIEWQTKQGFSGYDDEGFVFIPDDLTELNWCAAYFRGELEEVK